MRAGHAHHVAEAGEDHAVGVGDGDAVVDAAHRDHADRAAGAVHELDVRRQQVVDAVLVDRVRVAAADLHHLVVAARLDQRQDLAGDGAAERGVAELVDVLHAAASPGERRDRDARVHEHAVAAAHRVDERGLDRRPAAGVVGAQREAGLASTRTTVIGTPSSPQVMQWSEPQARPVGGSLTRSRWPSAPRARARSPRPSARAASRVARASSSSTCEIAKPTWISTQSPGPTPRRRRRAGRC